MQCADFFDKYFLGVISPCRVKCHLVFVFIIYYKNVIQKNNFIKKLLSYIN